LSGMPIKKSFRKRTRGRSTAGSTVLSALVMSYTPPGKFGMLSRFILLTYTTENKGGLMFFLKLLFNMAVMLFGAALLATGAAIYVLAKYSEILQVDSVSAAVMMIIAGVLLLISFWRMRNVD